MQCRAPNLLDINEQCRNRAHRLGQGQWQAATLLWLPFTACVRGRAFEAMTGACGDARARIGWGYSRPRYRAGYDGAPVG